MMDSSAVALVLTAEEERWLKEMEKRTGVTIAPNSSTDYSVAFNVLRWCHAYDGKLDDAERKLSRHLRVRRILQLDRIHELGEADGIDELAERYAPMTFLGVTEQSGVGIPVFLEQSGAFDLDAMMTKIRAHSFVFNYFRKMERILGRIRDVERESGQMSGAVLIIDLQGLKFQTNLVGFLSGTYRIFWGTLMEQYAFIFRKFVIVNAPTFMSLLWSACAGFIPAEYKEKVHLINTSGGDFSGLHEHVDARLLPAEFGGQNSVQIARPAACHVPTIFPPVGAELDVVSIPAGKSVIHTFELKAGARIRVYLRNEEAVTLNVSYSNTEAEFADPEQMEEALYAGCERPGLPTLDSFTAVVPASGHFHFRMGNEKAWLLSVQLEFGLFVVDEEGGERKVEPKNQAVA